jgi:hypothetical protein
MHKAGWPTRHGLEALQKGPYALEELNRSTYTLFGTIQMSHNFLT